jgi:hypothetical protein
VAVGVVIFVRGAGGGVLGVDSRAERSGEGEERNRVSSVRHAATADKGLLGGSRVGEGTLGGAVSGTAVGVEGGREGLGWKKESIALSS